jgi:dinuclear metal center YbgI/SA1388 family protein
VNVNLSDLVSKLDVELRIAEIKDYPNAVNGLQVANSGNVTKIAAAVDACEAVITQAVDAGVDLLIVHHGLFWNGLEPITGAAYRKLSLCLRNDLAVYSVHLPLDEHPVMGNNVLLCDALDLPMERKTFGNVGLQVEAEIHRQVLVERLSHAVGGPVHLAPGGPSVTQKIGVVTGGGGGFVARAAAEGIDTFITGEGPHSSYTAAEEQGINLLYAGHYATETFGVKALAEYIENEFGVPWTFIDHPTGL